MPEIGYWKYVRFTDDEPLYFGTDDDIVQIFDSADDRLEYRMKKDIRFEDDAGNEILTLDKVNRHVEIPVQLNVAALEEYAPGAGITVKGTLTFSGADLDLAGNLLKNPKLGTDLKTNNYHVYDGISGNTGMLKVGAGSDPDHTTGGALYTYGISHTTAPGKAMVIGGKVTGGNVGLRTYNAALTAFPYRLVVNQGDDPDIDIQNAKLDFHDQDLDPTVGAEVGHITIRVKGVDRKLKVYAVS